MTKNDSVVKQASDNRNELRDTAVIGAVGTGSSLLTNHIQDKLGLNGLKAKPPIQLGASSSMFKNPLKAMRSALASPGFRRAAKIGAIGGAIGLAGDYAAVKINNKMHTKQSSDNIYLEKISSWYVPTPETDKGLALQNTVIDVGTTLMPVSRLIKGVSPIVVGGSQGRDFRGIVNEEVRAGLTSTGKGLGYGLGGAATLGLAGAGIGKLLGNARMAKYTANIVGKVGSMIHNKVYTGPKITPKGLLDTIAGYAPDKVKAILEHKNLGAISGAAFGAGAGLVSGGVVGSVKGNYDGRLASIRNQINAGTLQGVENTKHN